MKTMLVMATITAAVSAAPLVSAKVEEGTQELAAKATQEVEESVIKEKDQVAGEEQNGTQGKQVRSATIYAQQLFDLMSILGIFGPIPPDDIREDV